jgi:hypothetical protein
MHIRVAHHLFSDTRFRRGYDYVNWGLVLNKAQDHPHVFDFTVMGTKKYHTSITVDDAGHLLFATCDCQGNRYCKHLAASLILLTKHKKDLYQTQTYLSIPEDFNDYVFNLDQHAKEMIEVCSLALKHAKSLDDSDILFEAYEFYMEQMGWLSDHQHDDALITFLEWMMDEFVSYWTSTNNDCLEMNFFSKQTQWIEFLITQRAIDPRRIIHDLILWMQLYPEIKDEVINDWLVLACAYNNDEEVAEDLSLLFKEATESVKDEKKLVEAWYFYALNHQERFPFASVDAMKHPKIARHLVEQAILLHHDPNALKLIKSQIQEKPKYEDIPWVSLWVMLCERNQDVPELKQALRWLFYCGEVNGYHQLKGMVDRRLWKDEVSIILEDYTQKVFSDWTYRQLLVLEKDWDKLKEHVQEHPWFISQLNQYLIDQDPDFVYDMLRTWIIERYQEFQDWQSIQPWISLFSSYFSEEQGWLLVSDIKSLEK